MITKELKTEPTDNKKRIEYIDAMKGICIFLVVLTHANIPFFSNNIALSLFRMPLYFFLSGLFFNSKEPFLTFFLKKTNNLIIPYLITWVLYNISLHALGLLTDQDSQTAIFPRSIWFLLTLFEVSFLYYFICKTNHLLIRNLLVFFFSLFGYYLYKRGTHIPLFIDSAVSGIIFFHIGNTIRHLNILKETPLKTNILNLLLYTTIFGGLLTVFNVRELNIKHNIYPSNYIATVLLAFSGTMIIFYFSKIIKRIPLINFFGRYSIIVLCFHIIYLKILWMLPINTNILNNQQWSVAFFIIVMLTMYPTILLVNRFIPYFYAQKPLIPTYQNLLRKMLLRRIKPLHK